MDDNRWTITISIPKPSSRISLATLLVITVVGGMFLGLAGRRLLGTDRKVGKELEVEIENVLKKVTWVESAFVSVAGEDAAGKKAVASVRAKSGKAMSKKQRVVVWKVVSRHGRIDRDGVAVFDLNSGRTWSKNN